MNLERLFCLNPACPAKGQVGEGNIRIHSDQEGRCRCSVCGDTFSCRKGTIFYRLRTNPEIVILILTLLAYAYTQGWGVSMPNPKKVRDWAKGVGYRVKTDRVDARILAHYGVERCPPLRPQLAVEVTQLDSLLKRRLDLKQTLHQEPGAHWARLSEMASRPGLAPQVEESLRQVIEALTQALTSIEQAIEELTAKHEPLQTQMVRLLALPGVGPKVVLPLLVKLFQWHNLTSGQGDAAGLVAYIGLDPQPYESGRSVRKHAGISKMGDSEVRRLLYMSALGAGALWARGKNPLNPFYQRLVGAVKQKMLHSSLPPAKFSFGPGPFFLAKLTGTLIFIKLGLDNHERISGAVKYEDIYLKHYPTVPLLYSGLRDYFAFYINDRPHQSLGYRAPAAVFQAAGECTHHLVRSSTARHAWCPGLYFHQFLVLTLGTTLR